MADYSLFPFRELTVREIFALAKESKEIGDDEFVKACMEAIRTKNHVPQEEIADDDRRGSHMTPNAPDMI